HVRRRIDDAQSPVNFKRVSTQANLEALRQDSLKNIAGRDVLFSGDYRFFEVLSGEIGTNILPRGFFATRQRLNGVLQASLYRFNVVQRLLILGFKVIRLAAGEYVSDDVNLMPRVIKDEHL